MTMADKKKIVGNLVKSMRNKKGLTQSDLSQQSNLSRNYISDIENGRYMPSVNTLITLASLLDIDLNVLLPLAKNQIEMSS